MPQARFLGRRWRIATDSLPLLFYPVLSALSIVMFILLLTLVAFTLGGKYECSEFTKVGIAMYGMTITYFLEIVLFNLVIHLGWRGGPLNESKRMPQMSILIHLWIVAVLIKLGLTTFGLFVVYSPTVSKSCWSSNPCDSFEKSLPKACIPGATGNVDLTPECRVVFRNIDKYDACFETWDRYGAGWMVDNFIGKDQTDGLALFNYPGVTTCRTDVDPNKDKRLDVYIPESIGKANIFDVLLEVGSMQSSNDGTFDRFPREYVAAVYSFISNTTYSGSKNHSVLMNDIPWTQCMGQSCLSLLENTCEQWQVFITLPDTYKMSGLFSAIMYVSLALILLTGLILFISFNAFPDYESKESWQGLLSGLAKKLGYMEDLSTTATDDGVDALVGIGGLLHSLFGGADLDVTDLLLGLYLVHLRQKWKRKQHALFHLEKHGYKGKEKEITTWVSLCLGFVLFPLFRDGYHSKQKSDNEQEMKEETGDGHDSDVPSSGALIAQMSSEIESIHFDDHPHENGALTLQHSFVRMHSLDHGDSHGELLVRVSETSGMKLVQQKRRLITPLNLGRVTFDVDTTISHADNVSMYMGNAYTLVGKQDLEEVLHFLPIARASYGLMKKKWRGCKNYKWYHRYQNMFLNYCGICMPTSVTESYHEKRNLKALVRMTGIPYEDVLYVSYTSSPLGVIPYLILVDSSTKTLCISMRGTVGAADLITDLLSSPRDISHDDGQQWLGGKEAYAHAGIVSSANAVISELKELGIWSAIEGLHPPPSPPRPENQDNHHAAAAKFSLPRALERIRHVVHVQGYGVVVTGHSLGAAVACIVSSSMITIQPNNIRCFAFNPPGGLFDDTLRQKSEAYCTTVVCGQDAISRMSIGTMKRMIDDMMFALASCIRPKLSILLDSFIGRYVNASAATHVFGRFENLEPDAKDVLLRYLEKSRFHQQNVDDRPMYPPGRIIFLRPYGDLTSSTDVTWDAVWIQAQDLMDEGLLLSTAMFHHHVLQETKNAIRKALENLTNVQQRDDDDDDDTTSIV